MGLSIVQYYYSSLLRIPIQCTMECKASKVHDCALIVVTSLLVFTLVFDGEDSMIIHLVVNLHATAWPQWQVKLWWRPSSVLQGFWEESSSFWWPPSLPSVSGGAQPYTSSAIREPCTICDTWSRLQIRQKGERTLNKCCKCILPRSRWENFGAQWEYFGA